jgi:hypothetical protein
VDRCRAAETDYDRTRQAARLADPSEISTACMMLRVHCSQRHGLDIMSDLYPPLRRAGAGYARMFLRMLGADDDAGTADEPGDESSAERTNGGRAAAGTSRRGGPSRSRKRRT